MDLSSTEASMAAQNAQPVNIYTEGALGANGAIAGGVAQTVNPGQMVTPAQYMAISQIMSGLEQTLVLSAAGAAAGGFASVSPATMSVLESLHIPTGVSLNSIGFNGATAFNVSGAATVNGALYALQQNQAATAVLNLGSLLVGPGAMLTTNLPSYSAMLGNVVASSGLTMNVAGTITNYGAIATSGPLSVLAGGAIYNQTLAGMPQASMVAQSVAMSSLANTIVNSGIITALSGNISMASQLASNLSVVNSDGVLQALNGSINFRSADFTGKFHLDVLGGDLLTQHVNMYSGDGIVNLYANDVTGRVNITAGEAHVTAATNNLVLGNLNLSGDPTFYNTNPLGDVTIDGDLVFRGQDLAIVANRNVLTGSNAGIIDTGSSVDKGGSVTIVAGADFSAFYVPSGSAPNSWPTSGAIVSPVAVIANDQDLVLEISGPSNNGGKIDLVTGGAITVFTTQSTSSVTGSNASGGNVTLVAFAGSTPIDPNAGTIKLPTNLAILTGGGTPDAIYPSGNFVAIAGGPSSGGNPAISMGAVDTRNTVLSNTPSLVPGGAVLMHAATPILMGGQVIIRGGTVMSGSFVPNTAQYQNALVSVIDIYASGPVQVVSGGSVAVTGTINTRPNFVTSGFPTNILLAAGVGTTANSATLSIGDVVSNGNSLSLISSAGIISASGHSSLSISTFDVLSTGHTPMGTINMLAGYRSVPTPASVAGFPQLVQIGVPGPSSFQGVINFSVPTTFFSGPSYGVQPGGDITILSYAGTVFMHSSSTISAHGGDVTIIAGRVSGQNLPNCTICLGSIDAGAGSIFVATEQPQFVSAFFGPSVANIPINNINPSTPVPVAFSSIKFGGSLDGGDFITVLAGLDIGFPAVSSINSTGQRITLAAGISQDPGNTQPFSPVNPGTLVLGSSFGQSISATGTSPQISLVSGSNLSAPGTIIAIGGLLKLTTNGGSIGPLTTSITGLTANAGGVNSGSVVVNNLGTDLAIFQIYALNINITNDGSIFVMDQVDASGTITLTTTPGSNGNISIFGQIGNPEALNPSATITLTADGSIGKPIGTLDYISGDFVILTSTSGVIGQAHLPILVYTNEVQNVTVNPSTGTFVLITTSPPIFTPVGQVTNPAPEENIFITEAIINQEVSATNTSIINGDGSPDIIATDATPQSHALSTDLTGQLTPTANLNISAETSEQIQTGIPGVASSGNTTVAELQNQGAHIGVGSTESFVILNQGNILFQPNHDITVQVQEGHVFIPDGAVAFVIETGHDVAVFDMHDGKKGPVRVRAGKQMITLSPGKQLVLTRQLDADFDTINPEKLIAHRNVQTVATTEGIRIYAADFSLPSMMMNVSPIKRMLASDNPAERRQARKLLKNAVVLAQLSGQKGPYNNSGSGH